MFFFFVCPLDAAMFGITALVGVHLSRMFATGREARAGACCSTSSVAVYVCATYTRVTLSHRTCFDGCSFVPNACRQAISPRAGTTPPSSSLPSLLYIAIRSPNDGPGFTRMMCVRSVLKQLSFWSSMHGPYSRSHARWKRLCILGTVTHRKQFGRCCLRPFP